MSIETGASADRRGAKGSEAVWLPHSDTVTIKDPHTEVDDRILNERLPAAPDPTVPATAAPPSPRLSDSPSFRLPDSSSAPRLPESPNPRRSPAAKGALALIRGYKLILSPLLPPSCRFVPTCSEYGHEAIAKYGIIRGGRLAVWRILRCNPFGRGGYDPVP